MPATKDNTVPAKRDTTVRRLIAATVVFALASMGTIAAYKFKVDGSFAEPVKRVAQIQVDTAKSSDVATSFTTDQRSDIEKIVRDYLIKNPELMLEIQQAFEKKMAVREAEDSKKAIADNAEQLYRRADAPSAGANTAESTITVVEFFDYNCGYCKRGLEDIAKLIKSDDKVRVVFKELPILSKGSEEAARVALAAKAQGKYWEVHQALLAQRGQADKDTALKLAAKEGLDIKKLEADMTSEAVTQEIATVRKLAESMNINGTPHFLVGDKSIPGAPENLFEQLTTHIKDLRENGCTVC